jgi:CheY-like chemotaxis protein
MIKNQIRLLVIEDEEFDVRRFGIRCVSRSGLLYRYVSNGRDALQKVAQNDYDVVVMDFQCRRPDGRGIDPCY